jgi:heme-degrading monooxygenase HmoA
MEHFIVTLLAKPGGEAKVASYYQRIGKDIEAAAGFLGRSVMRSVPGSAEQRAEHPPHDDEQSAQFIIHEKWESKEARWAFSSNLNIDRKAELFPHILNEHTHEYYVDALDQ